MWMWIAQPHRIAIHYRPMDVGRLVGNSAVGFEHTSPEKLKE